MQEPKAASAATVVLYLALVAPAQALAQATTPVTAPTRGQVGLRGQLGVPLGEFDENVGLSGGIAADVTYRLGDTPFRVGAGLSGLWYGRETRRVPFSQTIPDVLLDVTTSSGIWTTYALVRVQPRSGRVRPYGDALVGFNYVFTETSVDLDEQALVERAVARTTNFRDFTPSFGGGAGVRFQLVTWAESRLDLDVGARYVFGGEADYLIPESLGPGDNVADLEVNRSRTDVLVISAGVTFEF